MLHPSRFLEFLNHEGQKTVVEHLKHIVDLYKRYPEQKKESFIRYLSDLSNYLGVAYGLREKVVNLDDFASDLAKINITDPNFLNFVAFFTLVDCIKGRRFKDAKDFLQEKQVWERIETMSPQIIPSRLPTLRLMAGTVFFVREEFAEADRWFQANLDAHTGGVVNVEAMIASQLYHLIARFELGLTEGITHKEVLLAPLARRLGLTVDPDAFENLLLESLDQILKTGNKPEKQLKLICEHYAPRLKAKLDERSKTSHFHLFIGWMESKITGKSLRVTVDPYL
jgi:hypothetical protein